MQIDILSRPHLSLKKEKSPKATREINRESRERMLNIKCGDAEKQMGHAKNEYSTTRRPR